jgi:hypothetical protein
VACIDGRFARLPNAPLSGTTGSITKRYSGVTPRVLPNSPLWDQGAAYGGAYHHRTLRQAVRPEPRRCARPWRAVHGRVPVARPASPDRCAAAADAVDQSKRSTLSRPASIGSPMRVSVPSTPGRPRPEAFLPHRIDVRLWARPVIVTTKGATRCRLSRPNWLILSSNSERDSWRSMAPSRPA